ncbi:calcium-binding protein [Planktotalea sp.]|uniref:calcium-binding protein n=1 Tax=Planktotalea sp. TaxID=2029877 RepID=UPI0032991F6B
MAFSLGRGLLAFAMSVASLVALPAIAQEKTERAYVFGNSLIHHLSDSDETTVPHWMALIAKEAGHEFALSGQWGFLRDFMRTQPPQPNWSFKSVKDAWNSERRSFGDADLTNVWMVAANFIQYQTPDAPFDGENAENLSPIEAANAVVDWTSAADPNIGFYIYEGWPEMAGVAGRFPPNSDRLAAYHGYAVGDYAEWYDAFTAAVAANVPDRSVSLIPVSRILSSVMLETALSELPAETFYVDDAPHGTASLYLMAAMVAYNIVYNEPLPDAFRPPSSVAPELRATFPMVRDAIWERVVAFNAIEQTALQPSPESSETTPSVAPVTDTPKSEVAAVEYQEPVSDPSLAMGLNGIADWSVQHPFLDLMKTARPWVGHKDDQWGAFDSASIESGGYLDENGWPLRLPEGAHALETFVLTDQPAEATSLIGRYVLTYEGQGKLNVGGIAKNVRQNRNEVRFDYAPAEGLVAIAIKETNADDHIRNIKLYRESDADLIAAGVTFNPAWIARIENLRSLRFMDWMSTNGSTSTTWDKRASLSDYSYIRRGVPAETMIELANLVGVDPWFNMPHLADDTYFREFAELTKSTLRKDLRAYVEYSNEVWNFIFPQAVYAREQAQERWGRKAGDDAWMQFYGMRSAQMAQIWAEVFGEFSSDRLATVIGTHTGWLGLEEASLNAPLWVDEDPDKNWPPYVYFTDYAITGYFGYEMGSDEQAPTVLEWLDESARIAANDGATKGLTGDALETYIAEHKFDGANNRVEQALRQGSVKELTEEIFVRQAQVAEDHGLRLVMYEGGTHVAVSGEWSNNEALIEFFKAFNYTPQMAGLYADILTAWKAANGTLFNAFVDVAKPSQYGSWGSLRHLQDENPRWDALMTFNASTPAWWEERLPNAFEGGRILVGDAGENEIIGTRQADILLGQDGDDVLYPMGGKDKLNGGGGFDAALLPGGPSSYSFSRLPNGIRVKSNFVDVELIDVEMLWFEADEDLALMVEDLR